MLFLMSPSKLRNPLSLKSLAQKVGCMLPGNPTLQMLYPCQMEEDLGWCTTPTQIALVPAV